MKPRTLIPLVIALFAPASAHAGVFTGEVIDGPTPDIVSVGDVDLARDGTGAVGYVRRDGPNEHVFVSRLVDGGFATPERLDGGLDTPGGQPAIAASDGGRLLVAWVNAGTVYASVRPGGGAWQPPQPLGSGSDPAADMSITGAGYVTWSAGGDVRAARLDRTATALTAIPTALDVDPNQPAGDDRADLSDVAIAADGTGLAVWGEMGGDGRRHVYARRLFGANVSTAPQDLVLNDLDGHAGGAADAPRVQIEDDSSFGWVTYRQVLDGVPRIVARRLIGSQFEAPKVIDGMAFPAEDSVDAPSFAMGGRGVGIAATTRTSSNQVWLAPLVDDDFGVASVRVDGA